jgi:hypothetical protein
MLFSVWLPTKCLRWPFCPGVFIAILAFVAAAVTFRKEPGTREKAVWVFVFLALMCAEVWMMGIDRQDNEDRHTKANANQLKGFTDIGDGIKKSILESDRNFAATMDKENRVLDTTQSVASLAQRNLDTVTGKDSYPCIVPQSHAVSAGGMVPLVVWDKGPNILTGVEVRLMSQAEFLSGGVFYKPSAELGTMRPEWPKPLPEGITPVPDGDGIAHYLAEIWTQNGYYTQVINFRHGKYSLPWAYQYWLTQQIPFHPKGDPKANGMTAHVTKGCRQPDWSDDLGDGKPIPRPPS